jgi:fermentation-respiration switch protein FrsA (DUF1100 family)
VTRILYGLGLVAILIVLSLGLVWTFQRRLIYLPFPRRIPPAAAVLPGAEEVAFFTGDGLRLGGWFIPAFGGTASHPERSPGGGPAVIVFNGNAGNRSHRAPLAKALSESGLSVLLFDYRGYGKNPGRPTEAGLMADARAARSYLASRRGVDPGRLIYFGESLGAAVALGLALEASPAALVLRSPFTSLAEVAKVRYPYLPARLLLRDRYPSLERIRRIRAPVLVLIAGRDEIVPPSQTRRLYEAAGEPKRLAVIPGAGHNDLEMLSGPQLVGEVVDFLQATLNPALVRPVDP